MTMVHWEGIVRKKGDWLPRWEERYLVLDGNSLTYYNNKEDAHSLENMKGRMTLAEVNGENYGKAHGFLIRTLGHKYFHLCCSTELEKQLWIEMMEAGITYYKNHTKNEVVPILSPTPVDLRHFYAAFRKLLISHAASPMFFPNLCRDIVLTSNYAPTVPFWGDYHGVDGVLHFFSIVYETVEVKEFMVTDIAQSEEGNTAVIAGKETMKNRHNQRQFTQQWQHTILFGMDGRVKSLTILADPVAASAVFGSKATSNLSLPMAAVVGNTNFDNPPGVVHVQVFRGEQVTNSMIVGGKRILLGMRLVVGNQATMYAPTSSAKNDCVTESKKIGQDPEWHDMMEVKFDGASKGKACCMVVEAWGCDEDDSKTEDFIGVAKVNLAPFLALANSSQRIRESVTNEDIARGVVPQWYTLLSAGEVRESCGRVQLGISFTPSIDGNATFIPGSLPLAKMARQQSYRDTKRTNHSFQVGTTKFDIPQRYQMIKPVGQGAYGCVIAASDTDTGQSLAIKNVPKAFNDLVDAKRILREIRLMRHLQHPNLVNLVDLIRPASVNEFEDVYIVTDLMETDLHRVIHSNQALTDDHIQYFLYQMLVALKYVHSAEVLHRDLKPSNILVNSDCDLKLCDFGLARGVQGMEDGFTEYVVTRWYRAPELLLSSKYNKKMDVWAIGCILAECISRRPLFPGHDYLHQLKIIMDIIGSPAESSLDFINNAKAKRFILRQPHKPKISFATFYPKCNPSCLDLLDKMLTFNPDDRISIDEALAHPYLESVRDPSLEITCPTPFNFDFESTSLTKSKLQSLIFEDICHYHPEALLDISNDQQVSIPPLPTLLPSGTPSVPKLPSLQDTEQTLNESTTPSIV